MTVMPKDLLASTAIPADFKADMELAMQVTVRSGAGHWPYPGRVGLRGRVVRLDRKRHGRVAVGVRFGPETQLHFPTIA